MEQILDAPVAAEKKLQYAGFWIRVAASFIDGIILSITNFVVSLLFFGGMAFSDPNMESPGFALAYAAVVMGLYIVYFCGFESSGKQATPGKMAVNIKVGNARGEQISFGNAIGRFFAKFLSAILLYIGYIMVAWDDRKQGLHDKLADTFVFHG